MPRDVNFLREKSIFTNLSGDNETEILESFIDSDPVYNGYEDFIDAVKKKKNLDRI